MPKTPMIGPLSGEEEAKALAEIMAMAFAAPLPDSEAWLARAGHENARVLREGGEVAGGLLILPMGQWFGGRRVPMAGIAGVAVSPHHRARGMASRLMAAALREMYTAGWALSALYPATVPLYRRAGYELAGQIHEIKVPPRDLIERDRALRLRDLRSEDWPAVRRAYRRRARRTSGNLDRIEYFWRRVRQPYGSEPARGFGVWRGGELEGYIFYTQKRQDSNYYGLRVTDLVALTPAATRRLLTFFADHRTMAEWVAWYGTVSDPLLLTLTEHTYKVRLVGQWMLRIVDLAAALEARGYPRGVEASIHLRVRDQNLRPNNDRFVLEVSGGRGTVRRGGRGNVRIHVRGLGALYSGRLAPVDLVAGGLLEATTGQVAALGPIFAGPAPWMPDVF